MRYIAVFLAVLAILPVATEATQWGSRMLAYGLNTSQDNYPTGIMLDGTAYTVTSGVSSKLWRHTYYTAYGWRPGIICRFPDVKAVTIDPTTTTKAITVRGAGICWVSSSDGLNWTWGSILTAWKRVSPRVPVDITCAWHGPGKCLYATYSDRKIFYDTYPYNKPKEITNLGPLGISSWLAVRDTGDYMIISDGSNLYESTGSGGSWSTRKLIPEVNTADNERHPILGAIEGRNILLWSAPRVGYGSDIWYSKGDPNVPVKSTSLGRVRAIFH